MKDIIGEQIWERFFEGQDVELNQYVPFRLGGILNTALARADTALKKYGKQWDFTEWAKDRFAELRQGDDEAKGKHTGPYSPY